MSILATITLGGIALGVLAAVYLLAESVLNLRDCPGDDKSGQSCGARS